MAGAGAAAACPAGPTAVDSVGGAASGFVWDVSICVCERERWIVE